MSYSATPRQSAVLSNSTTQNPTIPAFGSSVLSGSLVAGAVVYDSAQTLNSISDNGGNNVYNLKSTITETGNGVKITSFSLGNVSGSPTQLTLHFSAATDCCAVVGEWTGGLAAADPSEATTGQAQLNVTAGANNVSSGAVTTATAGDLILGATSDTASLTANSTGTSPNAFTSVATASDSTTIFSLRLEAFVQAAAGSIAATAGIAVNGDNAATNVVAFKPAAGNLPPGGQIFDRPVLDLVFPPQLRGREQSTPRFLLAGQDSFPPGKQWFRPTNAWLVPERFAQWRSWTDSYKLVLIGKDKFNPGAQLYDLPPAWLAIERFAQWRSWTDSYKLTLIGKDALPPGKQLNYLPLGITWRPESPPPNPLVSLLSIIMPIGKQLNYLPSGISWNPQARTWTDSFKLTLIGKDALPPGKQSYALPFGISWRPDLLTWSDSYKLVLIGKDSFPPGTQTNYLPVGITWQPYSPQQNLNNTLYSIGLPPGVQLFSLSPFAPQRGIDFAAPNLLNTLLFPQAVPPGSQLYDLSPRAGDPFAQWRSWTQSFNLNLVGQDSFPVGAQWDDLSPRMAQRGIDFAAPNLLNTLLFPQTLPPGSQIYELPPRVADPFAQWRSWTQGFNLNLIGKDAFPPGAQWDDLAPKAPQRGIDFAVPNLLLTLLQIQALPPGRQVYDRPFSEWTAPFAQWRSWAQGFNLNLIGMDRLPPGAQVWELSPRSGDSFAQWRTWTGSYNPNLVGKDALPPGRQFYVLSMGAKQGIDFASPNLLSTLFAPPPVALPGTQYPTPFGAFGQFGKMG